MIGTFLSAMLVAALAVPQAPAGQPAQKPASRGPAAAPAATIVNINTATAADLDRLPGIGAKTAARIVDYRQKNGPFKKIEELMNVRGIGEKNFLRLRNQITVATSKPEQSGASQQ